MNSNACVPCGTALMPVSYSACATGAFLASSAAVCLLHDCKLRTLASCARAKRRGQGIEGGTPYRELRARAGPAENVLTIGALSSLDCHRIGILNAFKCVEHVGACIGRLVCEEHALTIGALSQPASKTRIGKVMPITKNNVLDGYK